MIKKIQFIHYRKLKDIEIDFSKGINIISGTNGTCKTSILHIISNSFQQPKTISTMKVLRNLNASINPKIETLTKGDKKYVNPAYGTTGTLYVAEYYDGDNLEFRRKNDKKLEINNKRFRIIPKYSKDGKETLPSIPVIYLGLSRLLSVGEIDDSELKKNKDTLPKEYQKEIASIYNDLTKQNINVETYKTIKFSNMKTRADFSTSEDGIDSNTISDGQDNLHILITALISLKYYYNETGGSSILLIDEADATLHPDLQLRLLKIFKEYSNNFQIQIIFTTHSLDLLEEGLKREYYNVIYLDDDIEKVKVLKDEKLDIYNIKNRLYSKTASDFMRDKYIPVYTEDAEARLFLELIFDHFSDTNEDFSRVCRYFYFAESSLGWDNLIKLFKDKKCKKQFLNCIGIVDGDVSLGETAINSNIIKLPGRTSVEKLAFDFSEKLFNENILEFWEDDKLEDWGFTRDYYRRNILEDIKNIAKEIKENPEKKVRELSKKCFNSESNNEFFVNVLKYWISLPENKEQLDYFYNGLVILYQKTAELNGISRKLLKND